MGVAAKLRLLLCLAGASVQLLQHGGTQLLQVLPIQMRLLADAVDRQRVCGQALEDRNTRVISQLTNQSKESIKQGGCQRQTAPFKPSGRNALVLLLILED